MQRTVAATAPISFTRFGELLKYLRRRARMTQRELAIEVGYSEVHISRLESSYRPPDEQTLLALFVPALDVQDAPELVTRLLELAAAGRASTAPTDAPQPAQPANVLSDLAALPLPPTSAVTRHAALQQLRHKLTNERVVAVCALAGVGKTTLVATLARMEAPTRPIFWLTFTAGVTNSIAALLRQLAVFLLARGEQQVRPLVEGSTSTGRMLTFDEQVALLDATLTRFAWAQINSPNASSSGLPLLCFDNVHLVQDDPVIMQVLSHLATTTPIALVLISRTAVALPGIAELRLAGLERDEGLALIAQLNPTLDTTLAERLLDKTGGNPMLLRLALGQLDQAADAAGVIAHLEQSSQVVTYLLDTTLRQLSASAAQLLALIAVVRQPINLYDHALLDLIQPADGIASFPLALAELQRSYLVDHPTQATLHPLVRDHLHATLAADRPRNERLHTLVARWSERNAADLIEATYHYAVAGHQDRAGELLTEQRHAIIAKGQTFEAAAIIDMLLQLAQQRGTTADVTRQLLTLRADLLVGTVRAAEAEKNYWSVLHHTTQPMQRVPIVALLAECLVQRGQAEAALDLCTDTHTMLDDSQPSLVAQLFAVEGHAQLMLSNYDAAYQAANQVLACIKPLAHAAQLGVGALQVQSYQIIATVLRYRQHYEQAATYLQRAITAARQGNLAQLAHRCQIDMVTIYFALGDLERGIGVCVDMVPQLQAAHDSYTMARLLSMIGLSYLMHGDIAQALSVVEQACRIAEDIGDAHTLADSQLRRTRILIAAGRIPEARSGIERLLMRTTATGEMQLQGYVLDRLAMIHLLNGDALDLATSKVTHTDGILPHLQAESQSV